MILGDLGLEIAILATKRPNSIKKRHKIEKNIFLSQKKGEGIFWSKKMGKMLSAKKGWPWPLGHGL